ncbi:MAG: ABC transporter ATP-binding protein [Anaerolineales bacterium]
MIKTENLTKHFGDFKAVEQVTLEVHAGEVLALLGPNGAGKTTTVRMLTSVLRPTSGHAWVAGYDVVQHPAKVRASVGVLTEHHGLYDRMPAAEYLDFFGQIYQLDAKTRRERAERLLDHFGLSAARHRRIGEFSKGMRQKLALARALIHRPPVLLLDEPTSAMDPESARLVRDALHELRSDERAIILCTHNLAEAEELAARIAIIRNGKIIANGTPAELKQQFLGVPEYEAVLGEPLSDRGVNLPNGVTLTGQGKTFVRFTTPRGAPDNPQVLRTLLDQELAVISLAEVPRSLEQVYLKAMANGKEVTI